MPVDTAALNKLVLELWGDVVSLPTPPTAVALWKEHQTIRRLLAEIDKVNPPQPIFAERQSRVDKLDDFLKWSERVAIETNRVTVGACGALGDDVLGLKATGDIEEKQWLVKVPRRAMLSWDDARKSTVLSKLFEQDPIVRGMDNVALTLMLICELLKGDQSRWQPYLNVLPEKFSTPLFFTENELEWLRPSPVFEDALKMFRAIARQFAYFHMIVQRNDQAQKARRNKEREVMAVPLLEKSPLTVTNFTFHLYKWAVACVSTRVNLIPSEQAKHPDGSPVQVRSSSNFVYLQIPALIPLLDMANHAFHCDGADKMSVHFCVDTDRAGCLATDDYSYGDDVHIFYGLRTNGDHLLHNGFVPNEDNPNDLFKLKLGLSKTEKNYDTRVGILRAIGLNATETFELSPTTTPIPVELIRFAKVFVADDLVEVDSPEVLTKAWQFIRDRLDLLLKGHQNAKVAKLEPNSASANQKAVVTLIEGERKILQKAYQFTVDKVESFKGINSKSDVSADLSQINLAAKDVERSPKNFEGLD